MRAPAIETHYAIDTDESNSYWSEDRHDLSLIQYPIENGQIQEQRFFFVLHLSTDILLHFFGCCAPSLHFVAVWPQNRLSN